MVPMWAISETGRADLSTQSADNLENLGGIVETMSWIQEGYNNFHLKAAALFLKKFSWGEVKVCWGQWWRIQP